MSLLSMFSGPSTKDPADPKQFDVVALGRGSQALQGLSNVRASLGLKMKSVAVSLPIRYLVSSAANTAYTTVFPIQPSSASEYATLAALFDECRFEGFQLKYLTNVATAGSGGACGILSYNPTNITALTTLVNGAESSQHKLICFGSRGVINALEAELIGANKYETWNVKVPSGSPVRVTATTTNVIGEWMATSDASNTCGYVKPYFDAGQTGCILSVTGVLYLHMRFRSRQ